MLIVRCFISVTLALLCSHVFVQEIVVINDPDGYTNLREGPSTKSSVIAEILEGEHFLFFPTDTSSWWLEDQKEIFYADIDYALDSATLVVEGWRGEELVAALKNIQPQRLYPNIVNGYMKSTARLNGIFPMGEGLNLKHYSYMGLEFEELKEIIESQSQDN